MPKICYVERRFKPESLKTIEQANAIIAEYMGEGFRLSVRQLFYQFVSRDLLKNTQRNYKCLGSVINDARLAGLIDWNAIEDREREVIQLAHWTDAAEGILAMAQQYRFDKWTNQPFRVEVWIEKKALSGVVEPICRKLDIPYLACKGYVSASESWSSAMRLKDMIENGQKPVVLHFGDHDPSGLDMTRDNRERLEMFIGEPIELIRMALNMDQVRRYNPPPNTAKVTDARFHDYERVHGQECWELDALEPRVIRDLIEEKVLEFRDEDIWEKNVAFEQEQKKLLKQCSDNWKDVEKLLVKIGEKEKKRKNGEE